MSIILALFVFSRANAGVISWVCDRFIVDSPYDYESAETSWLEKERDRLAIKIKWHKADIVVLRNYEMIRDELERRECFN